MNDQFIKSLIDIKSLKNINPNNRHIKNNNNVRVGFYKIRHGVQINIFIGKDVAHQIGIAFPHKASILCGDTNPRILFITSNKRKKGGYKVLEIPCGHKSICFTWKVFEPFPEEMYLKIVPHEIIEQDGEKFLKLDLTFDPEIQGKKKHNGISFPFDSTLSTVQG